MRETPAAYRRRTGRRYRPPAWLSGAAALAAGEDCPTLFRYPGPCGLGDFFAGRLRHLGPDPGGALWMAERALHADVAGARHFGTLAVLQPLRFDPGRSARPAIWVGVNRPADAAFLAWISPDALQAPLPWDELRDAVQARRWLDPRGERARVEESLQAYLEELRGMSAAGARPPLRPWCELPANERRRRLAEHGVEPRWTGAPRARGRIVADGRPPAPAALASPRELDTGRRIRAGGAPFAL